jgi:hypothetical protein
MLTCDGQRHVIIPLTDGSRGSTGGLQSQYSNRMKNRDSGRGRAVVRLRPQPRRGAERLSERHAAGGGAPARRRLRTRTARRAAAHQPRMLTNGGENAEAYFSADGRQLIFQATRPGVNECDQIFTMDVDGRNVRMVSTGRGAPPAPTSSPPATASSTAPRTSTARVPAAARPQPGLRLALDPYDIYTAPRRLRPAPPHHHPATTPRPPSRPTAPASSSPRPATATSTSTS